MRLPDKKFKIADYIKVIGAGFAGSAAAMVIATRGIKVKLIEMRPYKMTPAHKTEYFAEPVCSNSLCNLKPVSADAMLKMELSILSPFIIESAFQTAVPAGNALAVDRIKFSKKVTEILKNHPLIEAGPLTSKPFEKLIEKKLQCEELYFYDALAPIVKAESIDMTKAFFQGRYNQPADYLNCPLTASEYYKFVDELLKAEKVPLKDFEKGIFFEACLPIEELAKRGKDTLRFGPMKPTGLVDPRTGKRPFAVLQLRRENLRGDFFNMVGFQTRLKFKEQKKVFSLIPALNRVRFLRYGYMHRNTYINSPLYLTPIFNMWRNPFVFFAGQITGVEGYLASTASGVFAGLSASEVFINNRAILPPLPTAIGALSYYIAGELNLKLSKLEKPALLEPQIKSLDEIIQNKKEFFLQNFEFLKTKKRFEPSKFNFGLLQHCYNSKLSKKAQKSFIIKQSEQLIKKIKKMFAT